MQEDKDTIVAPAFVDMIATLHLAAAAGRSRMVVLAQHTMFADMAWQGSCDGYKGPMVICPCLLDQKPSCCQGPALSSVFDKENRVL